MKKELLITIAIVVPIVFVLLVAIIVCLVRRLMNRNTSGSIVYDRISHELDEEEVAFKNAIEMKNRNDNIFRSVGNESDDEEDELYGFELDDDSGFGSKDM